MRTTGTLRLILAVLSMFASLSAVASPASAQTQIGGYGIEGNVEAGGRFFIDEPPKSRRGKWEEYRDFPGGAFLGDLQLRIFRPDERYSAEIGGSKWGQQDQEFSLRSGRLGVWEFGFDWDETPHIFSTNARFLATETSRGVFTLPTTRPALTAHNSAPTLDEISVRWDTASFFLKVTPTPDLDLSAEYKRIRKSGNRPFGMAFGSPGSNFYEILEPIEQTIHDFRLKGVWARENWQLQGGYALSIFDNDLKTVTADNPCFGLTAAVTLGGCADAAAIATGRTSLPPDNIAHSFTLGGGVSLPWWRTRLTGNFAWSLQLQNDAFLPHTINPALVNGDLVLPQKSLNGNVQTTLLNLGATSRPITPLTLNLRYRLFGYSSNNDQITFPAIVVNDRSITLASRRAHRHQYLRQNAGLDGRWQFDALPVGLTLGAAWEQWRRNETLEVRRANEYSGKAALDATPWDWLLVRASYIPSWRRINAYTTESHEAHTVVEEEGDVVTTGQSPLVRKFNEADFNRNKAELQLQIMPLDTLTVTPTFSYTNTDYTASVLGLQQADGWSAGLDVGWTPFERVSFSAGYMHEVNYQKMRSRSRPASGNLALDFADFDWISNITDTFDTLYAGVRASIIPKVLDLSFTGSYAFALGEQLNRNPVGPASGTAAQNFTASAKRMPAFDDELLRLEAALAYHFLKNWTARFSYVFESFTKHDWRTDGLNPFLPAAGNPIWQGNDLRNYTAHILAATVGFQFK